jgi:hypothetical protein
MDRRTVTNSLLTSSAAVALLGLAGNRFGLPWLSSVLAIFKVPGIEISWDGIWLIVLVASAITVLFINFQKLQRLISKWREARTRTWDMNLCDAAQHVAFLTHFGQAWPENQRVNYAAGALYTEAKAGNLEVAGLSPNSLTLTKIPKQMFDGQSVLDLSGCKIDSKNISLLENPKGKVLFTALIVDRRQVQKIWKQKPLRGF